MSSLEVGKGTIRKTFGKIKDAVPIPNLIGIQSRSFNGFAQLDYLPSERRIFGLEKVLRDVFPVDYNDEMSLEYVSYELGNWACTCGKLTGISNRYQWSCSSCEKSGVTRLSDNFECPGCKKNAARYQRCSNCLSRVVLQLPMTVDECRVSGQTFSMPLKVKMQLISWDSDDTENKVIRDIKEQDVFFVDLPVMADVFEEKGRFELGSQGTFLINGVDRVVVSQLHRSPGVVFSKSKKAKDVRGRPYYLARIIPMRGSWIDFEFDSSDHLCVRVDKKKKILVTTFLQALGVSRDEIIPLFYNFDVVTFSSGEFSRKVDNNLLGQRIERGMVPEKLEAAFVGKKITKDTIDRLEKAGVKKFIFKKVKLINSVFGKDVVDPDTGEIFAEQGQVLTDDLFEKFTKFKKITFDLIASSGYVFQPTIGITLTQDKCRTQQEALKEVHSKLWPGETASLDEVKNRLAGLFFNPRFYDLTKVGRVRMNRKLGLEVSLETTVLTQEDIFETLRYLVNLRERGEGELDDIDHLGNRRVRIVGELLANQIYLGLLRIERIVRERFRIQEIHGALMPQDFLNIKPLAAVLREFFGSGQLSQFMDQTNPLSEIAHKRRLSALGPGGVMKDRATYEIRDVHTSHYGRICPIETPEGQTIGLISSLATYALVNDLGFIETAYRPVKDKKILDDVVFLDAFQETGEYIAQAVAAFDRKKLVNEKIFARYGGNYQYVEPKKISFIDLSPKQLVSVSSALIPFLEHDDASRALMGANMQRQAVPLIKCEPAIVATGIEKDIAAASGAVVMARRAGTVEYVSSEKIIVRSRRELFENDEEWTSNGIDTYYLRKFQRSSYNTWIHHSPRVERGQCVEVGDILTDGQAIKNEELALGSNLLVAFMPWHGYNFEDAIVLSKRLVADDSLTSVYIDEYIAEARDTKLGPEEITRDIPNVSEMALSGLDEDGIVRVGTRVKPGDILVGKVTLKGDIQYSPEEKLLRAIFGEKSRDVRDTSLRVSPGLEGTIIDVKIFSRGGIRKDRRYKEIAARKILQIEGDFEYQVTLLKKMGAEEVVKLLDGKEAGKKVPAKLVKDKKFIVSALKGLSFDEICSLRASKDLLNKTIEHLKKSIENQARILASLKDEKINKSKKGDPLPSGVIKVVKIYIATKRRVSVGDKIAGRHGNKGVVSIILPSEDMPYLEDGTPVDIVLNPLGVPSRMNVGQIMETTLGFIGKILGEKVSEKINEKSQKAAEHFLEKYYGKEFIEHYRKSFGQEGISRLLKETAKYGIRFNTPVFDGASYDGDVVHMLKDLGLPESGAFALRDGRTGEFFDQPATVGSIYMMKLNHMVEDKLHARSVGPYSLITQQPLGGKAQLGGQRLGEMEVWALEAHGAAYTLQEMLTHKSDDVTGRHKVYEAIVKGEEVPEPGIPESFNVLIKELQSLGLQVDLFKSGKEEVSE
ncbi:DNA-directed RNA polymerase subunit beta [bacterium]|jgi:DNA-directed RNA polymerase subunit beta|nr:DNA-directed RNA polymerase subunit beta [bacterium]